MVLVEIDKESKCLINMFEISRMYLNVQEWNVCVNQGHLNIRNVEIVVKGERCKAFKKP